MQQALPTSVLKKSLSFTPSSWLTLAEFSEKESHSLDTQHFYDDIEGANKAFEASKVKVKAKQIGRCALVSVVSRLSVIQVVPSFRFFSSRLHAPLAH